MLGRQLVHHRPLVDVDRGSQLALVASFVHLQVVPSALPLGEGQNPRAVTGGPAPVQRHGQALGLNVDPLWCLGPRFGHHLVDDGGPPCLLGPMQRALEAVEARERDALGTAEHLGEESRGPPRNHRDQGKRTGEVSEEVGDPRQRPRSSRVLHDGGQCSVEVEEQPGTGRFGHERREQGGNVNPVARAGQRQEDAVVAVVVDARSWPITTTTSVPVTPLTGTAVVSGTTCDGGTPMAVAIAAACCWKPAA